MMSWKSFTTLFFVSAICAVFFHVSHCDVVDEEPPTVRTSTAIFHGKRIEVKPYLLPKYQGSVAAYTRIPYAEPPLGDLRFRRPVPRTINGEFDATRGPIACSQMINPALNLEMEISEDCLYLDVFVPEPKPSSATVMVWIHGGGFQAGAGSIPSQLPIPLAAMNDVIVVTFNYRLNVFGLLTSGDEEMEANIGLLDQRQVLIWVQDNIEAFGGDPMRVTIFGESAGSACVNFHVLSPMSAGLFSGAIMQSGLAAEGSSIPMERAVEMAFTIGTLLNCSATSSTKELAGCLREKSAEEILDVFTLDPTVLIQIAPRPTAGDAFIPKHPAELTAEGALNSVKVLMGCNRDEGTVFISPSIMGTEGTDKPVLDRAVFEVTAGAYLERDVDPLVMDLLAFAYASPEELDKPEPNYADAVTSLLADHMFTCSTFDYAKQFSAASLPVYVYFMTHSPSASIWGPNLKWLGAAHGEDIPYVMGTPFSISDASNAGDSPLMGSFNDDEVEMSLQVMRYWSNFAKTGNPNLSSQDVEPDSKYPTWPSFTKEEPLYKELSTTFQNLANHPFPKRCYFKLNLLPKLFESSDEMARIKSLLEEKVDADSGKSCKDPESCPQE